MDVKYISKQFRMILYKHVCIDCIKEEFGKIMKDNNYNGDINTFEDKNQMIIEVSPNFLYKRNKKTPTKIYEVVRG